MPPLFSFKLTLLIAFVSVTFAVTDCEILNSGIPSINKKDCCTQTKLTDLCNDTEESDDCGITCDFNGRITEL
jgi:hypothetical protein